MNILKRIFSKKASDTREKRAENVEISWKDKFGNPFTIKREGNKFVKIIETNERSEFMFLGDVYSYNILLKNTFVKEYTHQASLQQDIYGRWILYYRLEDYYSMHYAYPGPVKDTLLWIFVENEADADMRMTGGVRHFFCPFISTNGDFLMTAHQPVATEPVIDIHSKNPFPASVLSNLYPSEFTFDGVRLKSMEGFLQSLKTPNKKMQKQIQVLHGSQAQTYSDLLKDDFDGKRLYWKGKTIDRFSNAYQQLLRQAYRAKFEQDALFRFALEATQGKPLTYSIGKKKPEETILTEKEFVSLLDELIDDKIKIKRQTK